MGSILGSLRRTGLTRSSQTWGRMPVGSYTHRRVVWRFAYSIGPRELSALLRPSLHRPRRMRHGAGLAAKARATHAAASHGGGT